MKKLGVGLSCLLLLIASLAGIDPIKFQINGLEFGPGSGPTMFSNVQAYVAFDWKPSTTSSCLFENLDFLDGTTGVTTEIDNGSLTFFEHINTVVPGGNPLASGQAGDRRTYTNAIGYVRVNNVIKLKVTNIFVTMDVSYPPTVGSGAATVGQAWGTIATAESDPQWITYFDPAGTGQVNFDFTSFSSVVQGTTGIYECQYTLRATEYQQTMVTLAVTNLNQDYNFTNTGLIQNFSAITYVHPNLYTSNEFTVNRINCQPSGTLPGGINRVTPVYWEIGTAAYTFTGDLKFDLNTLSGISNTANLRVLYRDWVNGVWNVVASTVEGNYLKVAGNNNEGQFTIGTIGSDTLPVELSMFNAILSGSNFVNINWTTESESNLIGYHILKSNTNNFNDAVRITSNPITAHNTTNTCNYQFSDTDVINNQTYYYWLNALNRDGSSEKYGPISILTNFNIEGNNPEIICTKLRDVYPNPIIKTNQLNIKYDLNSNEKATLSLFNIKGQKLKNFRNLNTGNQTLQIDTKELNSGVYLLRFESSTVSNIKKIMIIK